MAATNLDTELARIATTFRKGEKDDFINYVWSTEFAEWDAIASTDEAVKRANDVAARAEYVWNQYGGDFRNVVIN